MVRPVASHLLQVNDRGRPSFASIALRCRLFWRPQSNRGRRGHRDYVMLLFLYNSGVRVSEAAALTIADLATSTACKSSEGATNDETELSGMDHRIFGSFKAVCAIPPAHPLAIRKVIRPSDLNDLPFIALSPEYRARLRMTRVFEEAQVQPRIVIETPNSGTVRALALEGVGVGRSIRSGGGVRGARTAVQAHRAGDPFQLIPALPTRRSKAQPVKQFVASCCTRAVSSSSRSRPLRA